MSNEAKLNEVRNEDDDANLREHEAAMPNADDEMRQSPPLDERGESEEASDAGRTGLDAGHSKPISPREQPAPRAEDKPPFDAKAQAPRAGDAAGPVMIELIATRAELRRVEGELQRKTEELEQIDVERQDTIDKQARLQADFDNFRRRSERARGETYSQIVAEVVGKLLPVADNLRRALDTAGGTNADTAPELVQFTRGVELIHNQLSDVLQSYGVELIPTVGTLFDPHVHEAIAIEDSDDYPSNTITAEVVRGYKLGDKLLRPAMVKVAT